MSPAGPPCLTILERAFLGCGRWPAVFLPLPYRHSLCRGGQASALRHVLLPVEWLLAPSFLRPLQCIHLQSREQRGVAPSARQECLWEGASSMCIIFPLTQGGKLLGSGPGPCWGGSVAGVMVLVYHPDVSEWPGGQRDPGVEAHTCFDSGNAFMRCDGSWDSIPWP